MSDPRPGAVAFHLAIPVDDIGAAREFYGGVLGLAQGRSSDRWTDWDFYGHQLVTHQVRPTADQAGPPADRAGSAGVAGPVAAGPMAGTNLVDGHEVPVPHFGLVLSVEAFDRLAERLRRAGIEFVIEPHVRFEGQVGEQRTMFLLDPAGNALEFKALADPGQLFAT